MAYLTTSARARLVVEARPRNESIVVKVGDTALLSLTALEARELAEQLAVCADAIDEGTTEIATIARSKPLALQDAAA